MLAMKNRSAAAMLCGDKALAVLKSGTGHSAGVMMYGAGIITLTLKWQGVRAHRRRREYGRFVRWRRRQVMAEIAHSVS